ncbi:hypothetical protein HDU97_007315 [Phlyctochytrium planicorne]|nr:hypothetical protein HDU97_007315 [Phlyctochytrium planicorne]
MSSRTGGSGLPANNAETSVRTAKFDVTATSASSRTGLSASSRSASFAPSSATVHEEIPPVKLSLTPADLEKMDAAGIQYSVPNSQVVYPHAAMEEEKGAVRNPVTTSETSFLDATGMKNTTNSEWKDLPSSDPKQFKSDFNNGLKHLETDELEKEEVKKRKKRNYAWFFLIAATLMAVTIGVVVGVTIGNNKNGDRGGQGSVSSTSLAAATFIFHGGFCAYFYGNPKSAKPFKQPQP